MPKTQCLCGRGPCRRGQRTCKQCHNEGQKAARAKRKLQLAVLVEWAEKSGGLLNCVTESLLSKVGGKFTDGSLIDRSLKHAALVDKIIKPFKK